MSTSRSSSPQRNARDRLLDAAVKLVREQGFAGTSVDQLCTEAGVTKGAFFHHFASKEALGVGLANHWTQTTGKLFAEAPYHRHAKAADRVLGYIDFRIAIVGGPVEQFSCVAGTLIQESFQSSAAIRDACKDSIIGHARSLEADIAQAMADCSVTGTTAESLARHMQTVIQGSIILAKTQEENGSAELARESLNHLRKYFELLFIRSNQERES